MEIDELDDIEVPQDNAPTQKKQNSLQKDDDNADEYETNEFDSFVDSREIETMEIEF